MREDLLRSSPIAFAAGFWTTCRAWLWRAACRVDWESCRPSLTICLSSPVLSAFMVAVKKLDCILDLHTLRNQPWLKCSALQIFLFFMQHLDLGIAVCSKMRMGWETKMHWQSVQGNTVKGLPRLG